MRAYCSHSKETTSIWTSFPFLAVLLGILQIAGYFIAGMFASCDGEFPVTQPDTLLYAQAARRICEGIPFSFSEGASVSTGTTSVLYPFFLALPYLIGFRGASLLTAGFWLNSLFYLIFLWGWAQVILRCVKGRLVKNLAIALVAFSGQAAFSAMAQSDIGLWMAVSALIFAALACSRPIGLIALLILAPWVRPEGMMLVLSYGIFFLYRCWRNHPVHGRKDLVRDGVGCALMVLSVCAVFGLNYLLTGEFQFSSVAHKGHLKYYGVASGLIHLFSDGWTMLKAIVLSIPDSFPRTLYSFPVLGGLFLVLGIVAHDWKRSGWDLCMVLLAGALGFASVANSGLQGTNIDRYLAWILPVFAVFTAEGLTFLGDRCPDKCLSRALYASFVLFYIGASVVFMCIFYNTSRTADRLRAFAEACESVMTEGASVGSFGECGVAYCLSSRRVANLPGIYSPEFAYMSDEERMDDLKRNPEKRFDYWIFSSEDLVPQRRDPAAERTFGPCLLYGPNGRACHKADWSSFDNAAKSPDPEEGEVLTTRVDVGYPDDESRADYKVLDRWYRSPADPVFVSARSTAGDYLSDVGRVVVGGDEMNIRASRGKDIRVVMRQYPTASSSINSGGSLERLSVSMPASYAMNISVNGSVVQRVVLPCVADRFSDVSFVIPGSAIVTDNPRVAFLGDHIPFGYWFFMKESE